MRMHGATRGLLLLVTGAYPFIVHAGLSRGVTPMLMASLPLLAAGVRLFIGMRDAITWLLALCAALVLLASGLQAGPLALKMYPVLVSLVLLAVFALSLRYPPSMVERIARLSSPQLPPAAVAYTRQVTKVWCGFFVLNATVSAWTAVAASEALWVLYNGLLAYLMMGVLFAVEWLVRRRVRSRHA